MKILITGSEGFIGQYLVKEAVRQGHKVLGLDNLSKYGESSGFTHKLYDFKLVDLLTLEDFQFNMHMFKPDHLIVNAAMIGGIRYFHDHAFDILDHNERILAHCFKEAIYHYEHFNLKKITVLSSSMIYESALAFPLTEDMIFKIPPPKSTYGFQKLSTHYFCKGAYEQYGLPYTLIIPFNAVGIGETDFINGYSHVIPDLTYRLLKNGPNKPLKILGNGSQIRHYTYTGDLAKNIIKSLEMPECKNQEINIASNKGYSVKDLIQLLINQVYFGTSIVIENLPSLPYDVQTRIPSIEKAKLLGLECNTPLAPVLQVIINWIKEKINEKK